MDHEVNTGGLLGLIVVFLINSVMRLSNFLLLVERLEMDRYHLASFCSKSFRMRFCSKGSKTVMVYNNPLIVASSNYISDPCPAATQSRFWNMSWRIPRIHF